MNDLKKYIKDLVYSVKNAFSSKDDKDDLDKIIERVYENAFESLQKYRIIEHIENKYIKNAFESLHKYGIIKNMYTNYKKPKLEILEDNMSKNEPSVAGEVAGEYSLSENKIKISKKFIESYIDGQLKFLGDYEGEIKRSLDKILKSLGYKGSISDIQNIGYLYAAHNLIFLYPSYINERNKRESIAESTALLITLHEGLHSFDNNILNILNKLDIDNISNKLNIDSIIKNDSTTKYIYYLLYILNNILDNPELRASAFEVVMYYLVNGFHKDERGYIAAYANITMCRKYIEEINKLQNDNNKNKYVPYDLGFCYGNIIVAKYRSSLEENIHKIIDDIMLLNEKKAIEVIKNYVYNPDKLLHD
jgi:hypothetical protein